MNTENSTRFIGLLLNIYNFCDKYDLPKHTEMLPSDLLATSLGILSYKNNDDVNCVTRHIYFDNKLIIKGKFTLDQLIDIKSISGSILIKED